MGVYLYTVSFSKLIWSGVGCPKLFVHWCKMTRKSGMLFILVCDFVSRGTRALHFFFFNTLNLSPTRCIHGPHIRAEVPQKLTANTFNLRKITRQCLNSDADSSHLCCPAWRDFQREIGSRFQRRVLCRHLSSETETAARRQETRCLLFMLDYSKRRRAHVTKPS